MDRDLICQMIKSLLFLCDFFFCQKTSAVELSDIKQMKTPPPLPPKPERGLLKSQLAAMDGTVKWHILYTVYTVINYHLCFHCLAVFVDFYLFRAADN